MKKILSIIMILSWGSFLMSTTMSTIGINFENTPFHYAAMKGDLDAVRLLIKDCPSLLNAMDLQCKTPLHLALEWNHVDVAKALIAAGAEVNATDRVGKTPLHYAAVNGHTKFVENLIARGADVNATDKYGNTPLHLASMNGNLDVVRLLIGRGAEVKAIDHSCNTPLHYAANGHTDVARALIAAGADVNAQSKYRETPLDLAKRMWGFEEIMVKWAEQYKLRWTWIQAATTLSNTEKFKKLGDDSAADTLHDVAIKSPLDVVKDLTAAGGINTTLHEAIRYCDLKTAEKMLEEGTNVNATDAEGKTALCVATNETAVKFLIRVGADVKARDPYSFTPLHYAAAMGYLDVVKALIAARAEVNAVNEYGKTPLHLAVEKGHIEVVEALLDGGANVNFRFENVSIHDADEKVISESFSSLHVAAENGHLDVVKLLLDRGANMNAPTKKKILVNDYTGETIVTTKSLDGPLHVAAQGGHTDVVKLLIAAGAEVNAVNEYGKTPLHLAVEWNHVDVVGLLIRAGADVNAQRERKILMIKDPPLHGNTPLHCAAIVYLKHYGQGVAGDSSVRANNALEIAKDLLEAGADVNAVDGYGRTLLKYLIPKSSFSNFVSLLIQKGASIIGVDLNKITLRQLKKVLLESGDFVPHESISTLLAEKK